MSLQCPSLCGSCSCLCMCSIYLGHNGYVYITTIRTMSDIHYCLHVLLKKNKTKTCVCSDFHGMFLPACTCPFPVFSFSCHCIHLAKIPSWTELQTVLYSVLYCSSLIENNQSLKTTVHCCSVFSYSWVKQLPAIFLSITLPTGRYAKRNARWSQAKSPVIHCLQSALLCAAFHSRWRQGGQTPHHNKAGNTVCVAFCVD